MDLGAVGANRLGAGCDGQHEPLAAPFGVGAGIGNDAVRERARVARRQLERLLTGVQPREAQQVLHEPLHPPRMPRDDVEKAAVVVGRRVAFRQRFDAAANRGERRPQLVRDVCDEVAPDLIGAPQLGDVVQHDDDAMLGGAGRGRRGGHDRPQRVPGRRELQRRRRPAEQDRRDDLRDRRQPDRFHVWTADRHLVELQHLPRGGIHELQPRLRIDDDDALDHAGEDRFHPRAVARLPRELTADLLHRVVERARHRTELVVAVAEMRRRQVAARVAVGDAGDEPHAPADPRGEQPGDRDAADEREAKRGERRRQDGLQLVADVGERQRHAHVADRRMPHGHGHVQHVDVQRIAVPPRAADSVGARLRDLRPLRVVLHAAHALERFRGVAEDASVERDEGDARPDQRADPIRFLVELRHRGERRRIRQQIGREPRLGDERLFDPRVQLPPHRRREDRAGDGERDQRRGHGRQEERRLERRAEAGRHAATPRAADRSACSRTASRSRALR